MKWDIVLGLTPADPADGRPEILPQNGVVDGAGFQAGITPGAWITIYGDDLSATTRTWRPEEVVNGRLPTSLDGVSVLINGTSPPVYFVSPTQINVQAQSDLSGTRVEVVVKNPMGTSAPVMAEVKTAVPGFFLFEGYYAAAARPDGSMVNAESPAQPGESLTLYGTGFGPTSPGVTSGEVFQGATALSNPVEIRIGGLYADVRFAGLTGAGLNQFNIVVPNLPDGDHDVRATVAGARTQPLARLRVRR